MIAGDFFDRPVVDSEEFHVAQREFARLRVKGVPVFWIDGNHDRAQPSWGNLLPGVEVVHSKFFRCAEIGLYGISCLNTGEVEAAYRAVPEGVDVVVGHQTLDVALPMDQSYRLESPWVPSHVQLVVLGHVHEATEYACKERRAAGPRFVYTGSGAQLRSDEPLEKSFVTVSKGTSGRVAYERVPLRTRPFHSLQLRDESDLVLYLAEMGADILVNQARHCFTAA